MKLYKSLSSALKDREEVRMLKLSIKEATLPSELFFFPNLEELYLDGATTDLPKIGTPWPNLKIMSVNWPQFSGDLSALFSIPRLENLKILQTPQQRLLLPLGYTSSFLKFLTIKDCGIEALPEEISMMTSLQEANFSKNRLSRLPHSFPALKQLKRLNLDSNQFSQFPDSVKQMNHLSHLSIDQNLFSDEEKARIQREFHITPA